MNGIYFILLTNIFTVGRFWDFKTLPETVQLGNNKSDLTMLS